VRSADVVGPVLHARLHAQPVRVGAAKKLAAVDCYPHEWAPGRNPVSLQRWLQVRGEQVGSELAEAFAVARWFL
jgi:hypothetical protein